MGNVPGGGPGKGKGKGKGEGDKKDGEKKRYEAPPMPTFGKKK